MLNNNAVAIIYLIFTKTAENATKKRPLKP